MSVKAIKAIIMIAGLAGFWALLSAGAGPSTDFLRNSKVDDYCRREPAKSFDTILRWSISTGVVRSVRGTSNIEVVVNEIPWDLTPHEDKVSVLIASYCVRGGGRTSSTAIGYHDGKTKAVVYKGNYADD